MNLVMMTEGTGQGVHGRKTNVGRLYDLGRGELKIFLFGFSCGVLIMRVVADWLCQRGFPVERREQGRGNGEQGGGSRLSGLSQ